MSTEAIREIDRAAMTTEGNTDKAKAELVRLVALWAGVSDKRAARAVEGLITFIDDEGAFCELTNALTAGESDLERAMAATLAASRGHGAALAHEAIAWHGKERIMAFLRRWKGRDEEAIAYLLPAFEPDKEDGITPAFLKRKYEQDMDKDLAILLKRKYGQDMDKDLANPLFQKWAAAYQQEQARGLYEALKLLIPTDDESGREIHLGAPLNEVGALLREGAPIEKMEKIEMDALLDELDPNNGEQT